MFIIFLIILTLLIFILDFVKKYYNFESFVVNSKCKNNDIFKSINEVSSDINDLRYSTQRELKNRKKYNDMYRWYLNQKGIDNSTPLCGNISKIDKEKEKSIINKSLKNMFKKPAVIKPTTKEAAKNRQQLTNLLDNNVKDTSEGKIRQEWVEIASGKMVENAGKCPTSTKSWEYNLLEKCANGKTYFNTDIESEKEEKEKLEKMLDSKITAKKCRKMKNNCHHTIIRFRQKALDESYKYSVNQLRNSVRNHKEKSMNNDVKNEGIPKRYL